MVHPLSVLLDGAAHGRFPEPDGVVHVLPPLPGNLEALIGFTGTFVLTSELTQAEVDAVVPKGEFSIPMSAGCVLWIGERLGARPATHDIVFVAVSPGVDETASGADSVVLIEVAESSHPRVERAARYRSDLRVYETADRQGVVVLGRGITRRWEIAYEIEPEARNAGLGRALAAAALRLLPQGTPVWAQVAPGNAASVRAMIGAGFTPVCAEILFVREPGVASKLLADESDESVDFNGAVTVAIDDGVALITLDRPPLNALSAGLLAALAKQAHTLTADASVKAVVITGNDRAFAAGADVTEFEPNRESARLVAASFRTACDAVASIPRPVIAAIRGYALGGGLEVALACDLRVAADTTRVGQPEILLGIIPGGGATQRLARLVGASRAKEMIWSGRQVRADEALAMGLVDRVVPADDVLDNALEWARSFASGAAAAMSLAKRAIDDGLERSLVEGLDIEADRFADSFDTNDAAVGIASYLEKGPGKAQFTGS